MVLNSDDLQVSVSKNVVMVGDGIENGNIDIVKVKNYYVMVIIVVLIIIKEVNVKMITSVKLQINGEITVVKNVLFV